MRFSVYAQNGKKILWDETDDASITDIRLKMDQKIVEWLHRD